MENKKLTMREMICYGIGDITANVYLQFIALFAIVFYTCLLYTSSCQGIIAQRHTKPHKHGNQSIILIPHTKG